jgi:hypothetical protein
MTSSAGSKRRGRARRWVGALLAIVLLPLGAALLLYAYVLSGDPETDASPQPTATRTVVTLPVEATPSPGGSASGSPPETRFITVTTVIAIPPTDPGPDDPDVLALVTTVSGLLASVAGIVSAIVSVRAPRRQ